MAVPRQEVSAGGKGVDLAVRVSCQESFGGPAKRQGAAAPYQRELGPEGRERGDIAGGNKQEGQLSYLAPLLCHASALSAL